MRRDARAERRPLMRIKVRALRALGSIFPTEPQARMTAEQQTSREVLKASQTMGGYLAEMGTSDADVLDYGCGWRGGTLWLAKHVRSATGLDAEQSSIAQAELARTASGISNCRFLWSPDGRIPAPNGSFDAVFSTDTFEHVMDLPLAFRE